MLEAMRRVTGRLGKGWMGGPEWDAESKAGRCMRAGGSAFREGCGVLVKKSKKLSAAEWEALAAEREIPAAELW